MLDFFSLNLDIWHSEVTFNGLDAFENVPYKMDYCNSLLGEAQQDLG